MPEGLVPHCTALIDSTTKPLAQAAPRLEHRTARADALRLGRATADLDSPVSDRAALTQLIASGHDRYLRQMRRRYRSRLVGSQPVASRIHNTLTTSVAAVGTVFPHAIGAPFCADGALTGENCKGVVDGSNVLCT
jgi:hypothetical protein